MRFAVVGVGGTGGYFGGLLARAGQDVTFIARGQTLEVLQTRGLTVHSRVEGDFTIPVQATADPESLEEVDIVLFCVKAYDTTAAAIAIQPIVGPQTVIISVQNGVDNEERIAEVVGPGAVLGAIAGVSAHAEAPGVIRVTQEPGVITFGELHGGAADRLEAIQSAMDGAGFAARLQTDMPVQLWMKFVFICAFSGVTSLVRQPIGTILRYPETSALYRGVMEEAEAVGRARGVALPDDCVETWMARSQAFAPEAYGSMYHDLAAGRRMEVEWLNGSVVRLGREQGIGTPLNFAIDAALKPFANGAPPAR